MNLKDLHESADDRILTEVEKKNKKVLDKTNFQ